MKNIRIGLDIDECLADFMGAYKLQFNADKNPNALSGQKITRNVYNLRNNKHFWENLPKLRNIDFIPELYCTKRINSKTYTKNWLDKHGFPSRPIYQMYYQQGNKADMIKGRVDVFIDDSPSNVFKCMQSGVPALLLDTEYNRTDDYDPFLRIYSLDKEEIMEGYNILKNIDKIVYDFQF